MRADRLVSLVLLLRRRGRMTADELAAELEVSPRTVQRDIDALSTAGVPVYADRGRSGGYSLLPGFRTELTGLNHDEALALLTAGAGPGRRTFGLSGALASAMRKVVDALPEGNRAELDRATARFLVEPETDLLSRRAAVENVDPHVIGEVRRAVLAGRVLRFRYGAPEKEPRWHTVDPIGLVTVRDRTYLLAAKAGEDRTYRVSRMLAAEVLADAAERPAQVDLDRIWADRSAQFLAENHIPVLVRVEAARRDELLNHARAVRAEVVEPDGRVRLDVSFEDLRHAVWALWQLDTAAEALAPEELRAALRARAEVLADRYRVT
ncbi:WYL domain-containing protein [Tsukamurella tyrosinosolvens]|uniref:helix-turn-helix transcriptional regulator n=1 Tax=Tsukamurella tyrosinosolvens TaxID=57704 RepID=UPI0007914723|nr:WYL domain-containing protein [Tsukamurella tyrosinosolvens]KXP02958.1 DNA-binding transcriptional regulator [Tsukamurella tyrosinosolvens]KZL97369.1 DNA-binding transcriptional regulator [Tsukamurella tyrosinosolvens]MCA4997077.1 WYL domain-containing protein [Tsukamurella tyrosinosolvens]QRY86350.1 WYL domain-containing protein [Tsukamurella tyrosinosolvens]